MQAWWAAGLTIPAVIVKGFLGGRNKGRKEDELRAMYVRYLLISPSRVFSQSSCACQLCML